MEFRNGVSIHLSRRSFHPSFETNERKTSVLGGGEAAGRGRKAAPHPTVTTSSPYM